MSLKSFGPNLRAAVIGASGGVGAAFAAALRDDPAVADLRLFSRSGRAPAGLEASRIDVTDEASIVSAAQAMGERDLVLVATGLLHDAQLSPEKDMRALSLDALTRGFQVNAAGPALVAKHVLPRAPRRERFVFACLSARVGSIEDNRMGGWHTYRAAKAALNMLLKNLAIETARRRPRSVILGLQPGTVDTPLSRPFQGSAKDLKTPQEAAEALLGVVDRCQPSWSGGLYDWRGDRLPY